MLEQFQILDKNFFKFQNQLKINFSAIRTSAVLAQSIYGTYYNCDYNDKNSHYDAIAIKLADHEYII